MERVKPSLNSNFPNRQISNIHLPLNTSLCDGTLTDEYFPGFDYVIQQLSRLKDHKLLLSYLDWAMNKNQTKSVEIFTQRPEDELESERLRPDLVIERLLNYKEALVLFLEYLVFNKNTMVHLSFHMFYFC